MGIYCTCKHANMHGVYVHNTGVISDLPVEERKGIPNREPKSITLSNSKACEPTFSRGNM